MLGRVVPEMRGSGLNNQGRVKLGEYWYEMWTYGGRYKDPQSGNKVKYLDDDKVIVRSDDGRLDATFGAIPNFNEMLGSNRIIPEMPRRFSGRGLDMSANIWKSNDGDQIFGGVGTRPLLIPTAIDTFGCLDTIP